MFLSLSTSPPHHCSLSHTHTRSLSLSLSHTHSLSLYSRTTHIYKTDCWWLAGRFAHLEYSQEGIGCMSASLFCFWCVPSYWIFNAYIQTNATKHTRTHTNWYCISTYQASEENTTVRPSAIHSLEEDEVILSLSFYLSSLVAPLHPSRIICVCPCKADGVCSVYSWASIW